MTSERLTLIKRVGCVPIEDMEPEQKEVNGVTVKFCLNCGKPIPQGNRKYCSPECSKVFFAKHNQRGIFEMVFEREKGICQECGHRNSPLGLEYPQRPKWNPNGYEAYQAEVKEFDKILEEYHKAVDQWRKLHPFRDFIADHIVPISLGGPEFELGNVQLLCSNCNRLKTKSDKAKIAMMRKYGENFQDFWQNVNQPDLTMYADKVL